MSYGHIVGTPLFIHIAPLRGAIFCTAIFYRHSTPTGCEEMFFLHKLAFKIR